MLLQKLGRSLKKNFPEIQAFATGKMPQFIYGKNRFEDIPNFCFHAVEPDHFEAQLAFLKSNGYITLDATELESRLQDPAYRNNGKEIVLTFDDGLISLWHVAFPLLKKYEYKAISFILPGLIEEGQPLTEKDLSRQQAALPAEKTTVALCSWAQIKYMHDSGVIDFQSHGLYHPLVSVSPRIIDFVGIESGIYYFGNSQIPFYGDGTEEGDRRENIAGHPIYASASRYAGRARYFDDLRVRAACEKWVSENGGVDYFSRPDWKKGLFQICTDFSRKNKLQDSYETPAQRDAALDFELRESKVRIESRLPGKVVRHFCNPWFIGSERMAVRAKALGYAVLHLGATRGFACHPDKDYPKFMLRSQEEYLTMLPGKNRKGFAHTLKRKFSSSREYGNKNKEIEKYQIRIAETP